PLTPSQTPSSNVSNGINALKPYDISINHDNDNDIIDFSNSIPLAIISIIVSIIILGLDLFLVFTTIKDAITG
ncbi:13971_t:CDS:1, partial [Dentiscutata erythropus]